MPDDWPVYSHVYGRVRADKSIVISQTPFDDGPADFTSFINRDKDWLRQQGLRKQIKSHH